LIKKPELNLIYFETEELQKGNVIPWRARMVDRLNYVVEDPETKERIQITEHKLSKRFEACPENKNRQKKVYLKLGKTG